MRVAKSLGRSHISPTSHEERHMTATGRAAPQSVEAVLSALKFDANGLVAAVAQQHDTGEVLMLAWMNRDAVAETLATGRVTYFSRSRQTLWRKGETSGQTQRLIELRVDC